MQKSSERKTRYAENFNYNKFARHMLGASGERSLWGQCNRKHSEPDDEKRFNAKTHSTRRKAFFRRYGVCCAIRQSGDWPRQPGGGAHCSAARSLVAEKFLAFLTKKTADDRDVVIALAEYKAAGNEAGSPLVIFRAALASVRGDVFLRNAVNHRANPGPHARAGAHRARFVRGVEDEVWQTTPVATAHVLQRFQLDVFNARARSLTAVTGATDDNFAFAHQAGDNRADGIITAVTGKFGLRNSQLHKLLFRFV